MTDNSFLYILLIFIVLIIFLAYMPIKSKNDDENEMDKPDLTSVKKKLYSEIMAAFGEMLDDTGKIVVYESSKSKHEPIAAIIIVSLPYDMIYLKIDYNYKANVLVQFRSDCFVKLNKTAQSADIYSDCDFHDTSEELVTLCAALNALSNYQLTAVSEV